MNYMKKSCKTNAWENKTSVGKRDSKNRNMHERQQPYACDRSQLFLPSVGAENTACDDGG